jgi:ribulose kinase
LARRSTICCDSIQHLANSRRARAARAAALEKDIVARASGLSQAAIIAEGLHVLPDFIGSRSPSADPGARGGVMGMDLREDAASLQELYVAGVSGLAYGLADIVGKLERSGYQFDTIIVSGGAARSGLVRQIIADVCGKTVESPETPEPVLLGSAMVGAVGPGPRPWPPRWRRCRRSREAPRRRRAGRSRRSTRESAEPTRCCAEPNVRFAN